MGGLFGTGAEIPLSEPHQIIRNLSELPEKQFLELEIQRWKSSEKRKMMLLGERYYQGFHDILERKRTVIGQDGQLQEVRNLPNNHVIDNQYAKMVNQKNNYLLGKPLTFDTDDKRYEEALNLLFDKRFHRILKNVGESVLNCAIGWLYPYCVNGDLLFRQFESYEILPFWSDAAHTRLDCAIRLYQIEKYIENTPFIQEKVEVFWPNRVDRYDLNDGILTPDIESPTADYLTFQTEKGLSQGYSWGKVPLIPFKYNRQEIPLIQRVKSLQDGINAVLSDFQNNMQEDSRNTILVVKNYGGADLGELRYNLATYGAVKVETDEGVQGGVDALRIDVNAENYKTILELFKKALLENAMGCDAKGDRLSSGTPNQMNIQSMYSDIDLDANAMETEFQASFEDLLEFVRQYLKASGKGDFSGKKVNVIFNRDILINESESIENCVKSMGILSEETITGQHPWTLDLKRELERKKREKQESIEEYTNAFPPTALNGDAHDGG